MNIFQRTWRSFLLGPIFFIPFGLVFFGIGAGLSYKSFVLQMNGAEAAGRVIGMDEQCDDDGCAWAPVVSFQSGDGATETYYSTYYSGPPAYDVGQNVIVVYDPANPEKASIKGEGNVFRVIFMSVGGIIMCVGIYLFIRNLSNPAVAK